MTPIRSNGVLKRHTEQISQTHIFGRDIRHWYTPSRKEFLLEKTFALNFAFFFKFCRVKFREGRYQMCFTRASFWKCGIQKEKEVRTYELQHFMRNLSFSISNILKSEFISLSIWNYLKLRHRESPLLHFWRRFFTNFLRQLREFNKFSRLINRKLMVISFWE